MNAMAPPRTMLDLYRGLPEGTLCQLINNQLIMSPAPTENHQKVLDRIYRRLGDFIEKNQLGEVRVAPYDVYLGKRNVYQPDILFIGNNNLSKIQSDGLHGAPDLIIEILSSSTAKYDLEDKKEVYEQFGVWEYWIVDPSNKQVWGYQLVDNCYQGLPTAAGEINSFLLKTQFIF